MPREIEPLQRGPDVAVPHVGGLHHRYGRRAASLETNALCSAAQNVHISPQSTRIARTLTSNKLA
jgi:hypothetical protein